MALQIIDKVPMRVVEDTIHGYFVMQKIKLLKPDAYGTIGEETQTDP